MRRPITPELQHYLGSFLLQTAMIAALTLIPFFCFQHLGGRERSAALAYGVQTLSLGITCFLSAPFVSRWQNGLWGCLIGAIGFGAFYFLASFTTSIGAFCVLTGIAMSFFALAWPAMQSWLGSQPDEQKRTKSLSYFNIAIGIGLTVGPLVSGILYGISFRLAFFAAFLLSVLAALLLFTLPPENEYFIRSVGATEAAPNRIASKSENASELFLYCGWLTNMLGWGMVGSIRTVYAGQVNGLVQRGQMVLLSASEPLRVFTSQRPPSAATLYSVMQAVLSLGYFAAILVMGRTVRWQHRFWIVAAFEFILGAAVCALADSRSLLVILACHAVLGMFAAFGYLSSQSYSTSNYALKHRRIAVQEGLSQSSGFALPLLFAQCSLWYGLSWPFRRAFLLIGAFAALQLFSLRLARSQPERRKFETQNA
jgi:MFS family permease